MSLKLYHPSELQLNYPQFRTEAPQTVAGHQGPAEGASCLGLCEPLTRQRSFGPVNRSDAYFGIGDEWLSVLLEEGSRARFARAESDRFRQQENEVLHDSAVALCLAEATSDAWKKVSRAVQRESFFQVSGPLRGGVWEQE
jgi:hypothetical protein